MVLLGVEVLRDPEPLLEVLLDVSCPVSKGKCVFCELHSIVTIFSFLMEFLICVKIVF